MPIIQSKKELVRNMLCIENSFAIASFGVLHLMNDMILKKEIGNYSIMPPNLIELNDLGWEKYLKNNPDLMELGDEFINKFTDTFNYIERNYVKESYEAIKTYCKFSNQTEIFEKRPWYRMATVLRNSLVHDGVIQYGKYDIKHLEQYGSITLYDVEINLEDNGKYIYTLGWDRHKTMMICDDMVVFSSKLK